MKSMNKNFRKNIFIKVVIRFVFAILFIGVLLFVPAGTFHYFNGWLFMAGLFIPMMIILGYLLLHDPELLEKRMKMKEKEKEQKRYIRISLLLYLAAYVVPGLDYRFHWSEVPLWLVFLSFVIMIGGYFMFIAVMLQNRYASRVVEIQQEQQLIDTGLYAIVRHPMYLAATILFFASVLVLGSWYALLPMAAIPVLLGYRIKNEEKVLINGLPGYTEYMQKVRYRMVPFVW